MERLVVAMSRSPADHSIGKRRATKKMQSIHVFAIEETSKAVQDAARYQSSGPQVWRIFDAAAGSTTLAVCERTDAVAISKSASQVTPGEFVCHFQRWTGNVCIGRKQGVIPGASPFADQILVLAKFNVFRALVSNSVALGFPTEEHMKDDAVSPFCVSSQSGRDLSLPSRFTSHSNATTYPPSSMGGSIAIPRYAGQHPRCGRLR